jgi:hypothetical protein
MSDDERHTLYWIGYSHGRRTAEHQPGEDHERALRANLALAGNHQRHRAFALGELRGYRQATDAPYVEAHRLEATDDQINRSFDAYR